MRSPAARRCRRFLTLYTTRVIYIYFDRLQTCMFRERRQQAGFGHFTLVPANESNKSLLTESPIFRFDEGEPPELVATIECQ
jgi:hypothetical protein